MKISGKIVAILQNLTDNWC